MLLLKKPKLYLSIVSLSASYLLSVAKLNEDKRNTLFFRMLITLPLIVDYLWFSKVQKIVLYSAIAAFLGDIVPEIIVYYYGEDEDDENFDTPLYFAPKVFFRTVEKLIIISAFKSRYDIMPLLKWNLIPYIQTTLLILSISFNKNNAVANKQPLYIKTTTIFYHGLVSILAYIGSKIGSNDVISLFKIATFIHCY
jgi:hypothetical protein